MVRDKKWHLRVKVNEIIKKLNILGKHSIVVITVEIYNTILDY